MGPSRRANSIPVALLLLLGPIPTLQAQFIRQGFWLSGGPGYGSATSHNSRAMGGFSGNIAGGWALSPKVQLGLGVAGWGTSYIGESGRPIGIRIATLDARVRYYPDFGFRFFFTTGLGLGIVRFTDEGRAFDRTGIGLLGGAGYDIRIAPNLSVTPYANYYIVRTTDPNADVGQIGLALTIY